MNKLSFEKTFKILCYFIIPFALYSLIVSFDDNSASSIHNEKVFGISFDNQIIDGKFTGLAQGTPSFREGKISRLKDWLENNGMTWSEFSEIWFYSDSLNDLPLLSLVSNPVAVDPDPVLKKHAIGNGWPIISLR